jgi:type II secretion system protein L
MSEWVGIHLGYQRVTAVSASGAEGPQRAVELTPPENRGRWIYSEADVAHVIESVERELEVSGATVQLVLPIGGIYFRRVALPQGENSDQAARFAAEPQLPLPLEQLHVVVLTRQAGEARLLAIPHEPWARVLQQIDDAGWICPTAWCDAQLTGWRVHQDGGEADHAPSLVAALDARGGWTGVFDTRGPLALRPLGGANQLNDLAHTLEQTWWGAIGDRPRGQTSLWLSRELASDTKVESVGADHKAVLEQHLAESVPQTAGGLVAQWAAEQPPEEAATNLRRHELSSQVVQRRTRQLLLAHACAVACVLLAVSAGLIVHGQQLQGRVQAYQQQTTRLWQSVYPDREVPTNVVSRLTSEVERERGLRSDAENVPDYASALDVLRDLVSHLPDEVPIRIRELEIASDTSIVVGEARSHGAVEQIAQSLSSVEGFAVEPARTERTRRGSVRFTIRFQGETADA